jgi:outer membrane receptor for ferric coprogen and ferric-rhodotorulic acid
MRLNLGRLTLVMGFAAALAAFPISSAIAQTPPATNTQSGDVVTFDLPAQPINSAALAFSKQSGVQLVFGAALGNGVRANAVEGKYTVREALDHLLAGTGLGWRFLNDRTVTIEAKSAAATTAGSNFGTVQVQGTNDVLPDLTGFGAGAGPNGSSDVTATEGTGSLTTNGAVAASKGNAPLTLRETPQTVTVMTHEQIEQQNFTDMESALYYMPGVTIAQLGTQVGLGGTDTIMSRAYQVQTFTVDGGGPLKMLDPLTTSGLDLDEYDHIEMLQGSSGLFGGYDNNPGGVIALDRKRPLDHEQFTVDAHYGSWDDNYVSLDATSPLGFDGHLRGRVVVDYQNQDFFYKDANQTHMHLYGTLEGDLGPDTLLRVGGSYTQQSDPSTNPQGLPRYNNGGDLHLPQSTCLCAPWNRSDSDGNELFGELDHRFSDDWSATISATDLRDLSKQKLDYLDPGIGAGATSTTSIPGNLQEGGDAIDELSIDAHVNGAVTAFGLPQRLVLGYDRSTVSLDGVFDQQALTYAGNVFAFNPNMLTPEPAGIPVISASNPDYNSGAVDDALKDNIVQSGLYLNLVLNPVAPLHINGGLRYSDFETKIATSVAAAGIQIPAIYTYPGPGDICLFLPSLCAPTDLGPFFNSTTSTSKASGVLTWQAGASYDITDQLSGYASYAVVYNQQSADLAPVTFQPLGPISGETYEGGFKWSNGKLNASAAYFYSGLFGQGVQVPGSGPTGCCFEQLGTSVSDGIQLLAAGEILPGWDLTSSYTYDNNYNSGVEAGYLGSPIFNTQQPHNQLKIWTSYILPGDLHDWTVAGGFRLESARAQSGTACSLASDPSGTCTGGTFIPFHFTQPLYTVLDLEVGYHFNDHWATTASMTNVADTRYYATAGAPQGGNFYGQPRAFMIAFHGTY